MSKFLTMMMDSIPVKNITSILNMVMFEMLIKHKVEMMREINLSRNLKNFIATTSKLNEKSWER